VRLDARLRVRDRLLLTPTGRLLRLGADGPKALADVQQGKGSRAFARRLVDAGAAHPVPPPHPADDVTVVIPVRDRHAELDRCLTALARTAVVVDDGSLHPVTVRRVCERHGATYVHRPNGGPAAARNTGLEHVTTPFVAFLDSDCVVPPGWLEQLRGHLEDPTVVAAAPRIVGGPRSPLDLGPRPAIVRPGGEVSYVPTAALLLRREGLRFDEALRYGEDVDLVWRLDGTVRYDPSVVIEHTEPRSLTDRLIRRFHYGTSAAPLSQRHPDRLAHLVLPPWPTAVLALLLARRPLKAAIVAATMTARLDRQVQDRTASAYLVAESTKNTALGLGRALALLGPLGWSTAPELVLAPYLVEWWERRPDEGPLTYTARALLDQAAYGAGVLTGCLTHRTTIPLRPRRK
jgi:mycofactocin system glycosyltransferase